MIEHWKELHWQLAAAPTLVVSGVRKIVGDVRWDLPGECLLAEQSIGFEDIGYSEKGKLGQLKRNYWNQELVDKAIEKLLSRKDSVHASAAIRMQAGDKDARSSGFCIQNLVITVAGERSFIDIYYRSTEVSMKFLADLIFFSHMLPPVFAQLGIRPELIRFKFANCFMSALYQPIFLRFEEDPVGFYEHLEKHDSRFHRTYSLATSKYLLKEHHYSYRMRVRMYEYFREHISRKKQAQLRPLFKGLRGKIIDEKDDE